MITRRDIFPILGACALAAAQISLAQRPPTRSYRLAFLGLTSPADYIGKRVDAFRAGLRDLGYVEGKNLSIDFAWAEGKYERLPGLAAQLLKANPDVLITYGAGSTAARNATSTVPIVIAIIGDPIAAGLVTNLARPGGNVTGSTVLNPELGAKRLELLREALPRIARVAVLLNPGNSSNAAHLKTMASVSSSLKIELKTFEARSAADFASVFSSMAKKRVDAVVVADDAILISSSQVIAQLGAKHGLPLAGANDLVEAGALIGYAANTIEIFRRAAYFVDRILKGAKPADLPFERATKFEFVLNMKTAKALGVKFPQSILVRADRVIE